MSPARDDRDADTLEDDVIALWPSLPAMRAQADRLRRKRRAGARWFSPRELDEDAGVLRARPPIAAAEALALAILRAAPPSLVDVDDR